VTDSNLSAIVDGHLLHHPIAGDPRAAFKQGALWAEALLTLPLAAIDAALSQEQPRQPDSEPESPQAEPVAWISVEDRLPDTEGEYLLWDGRSRHAGVYEDGDFLVAFWGGPYRYVTHWATLLPAPPAAAQGGQPGDGTA